MFMVTDRQLALMRLANIAELAEDTSLLLQDEFPEFVKTSGQMLQSLVYERLYHAATEYRMTSFDALQDYLVLTFQHPVLNSRPLPPALHDLLTWKGMEDGDKVGELQKILEQ